MTSKKAKRQIVARRRTARASAGSQPEPGDILRWRGHDYVITGVFPNGDPEQGIEPNSVIFRRGEANEKGDGSHKGGSGELDKLMYADDDTGTFWYLPLAVAEHTRGHVRHNIVTEIAYSREDKRDDLAIVAVFGEARGIPGAPPVMSPTERAAAGSPHLATKPLAKRR
jgi:hypothetical protein